MSIALSEFWTRLVRSGVSDAAGCKQVAAAYRQAHDGTPPSDSVAVAEFMVKAGRLTEFQAQALLADPPREIRLGDYLIRGDQTPAPLGRWVEAARIKTAGEGDRCGYLLRTTAGNAWLDAHAQVQGESLQSFQTQVVGSDVAVFTPLAPGASLLERIGGKPIGARRACEIGMSLSQALEALHARSLVHGSVRADRVWVEEGGKVFLLRDPSGPPVSGLGDVSASWLDTVDSPESYVAPELASGQQTCSVSSDLYSLGCLLFRLTAGRPPVEGGSIAETLAAHSTQMPAELEEAIAQGQSGDPMYRVLAYAMAKNPAARFSSAGQLTAALKATLPLLPATTVAETPLKRREGSKSVGKQPSAKPETKARPAEQQTKQATATSKSTPTPTKTTKPPAPKPRSNAADSTQSESKPSPVAPPPQRRTPERPAAERTTSERPASEQPSRERATPAAPAPIPEADSVEATPPPPPEPRRRRRGKKKSKAPLILVGLTVVVLLLMIGLLVRDPNEPIAEKKPRRPLPTVIPPVSGSGADPAVPDASPVKNRNIDPSTSIGYELVVDDRLLFAPPYAADAPPAPLELLPPGPAMIVSVKLASVQESEFGKQLSTLLSPELSALIESAATRAKVSGDSIERCSIALHPGSEGWPKVSLAIQLSQPQPLDALIDAWQAAASRTAEGATIYAGDAIDADAFYIPAGEVESKMVSRFAVGPVDQISEVAAGEGGAIPLPRSMQSLWNGGSQDADLVVLFTPNFLFADGRAMLQSFAPELSGPLKSVLIPDVAAVLLTATVDDDQVFAEARLSPSGGISEASLMRTLSEAVGSWPTWADEFIVDSVADPSWRLLASRLPLMMRFVTDRFRYGISDQLVVANVYLPRQAVSQVTFATLLAMNTPSGGTAAVAPPGSTKPLTVDQMLDRTMSVSFDQESLEFAINVIVGEYQRTLPSGSTLPPVRIIGGDLQTMGITQNQQIRDFAKTDVSLRSVLTDLVVGANPDKSATGPRDPKQSLIWVLADDPDNAGKTAILVTTRVAAEGKYELPEEFRVAD